MDYNKESQLKANNKYRAKFARPEIKINKEDYEAIQAFVKSKGYKGINEYVNCVLAYDIKNNVIPNKKDIEEAEIL
jgi:hypothetical protein